MTKQELKPTWLELKSQGFVYRLGSTGTEVINASVVNTLFAIIRLEYKVDFAFSLKAGQHQLTRAEYEEIRLRIDEGVRIFSYEETKSREEIIKQILTKTKQRGN